MPFADFKDTTGTSVLTNRRILDNADFAISMMERATKHTALLQDIEQKKEKFVTDQILDTGRIEQQALQISQMRSQQEMDAKTRDWRLAEQEARGRAALADIDAQKSEATDLADLAESTQGYLGNLRAADSYEEVQSIVAHAQANYAHLLTSKTYGAQAKSFLDKIAGSAMSKAEPYIVRSRTAAQGLADKFDGTPDSMTTVESHPDFRYAMQDPEFKKMYSDAKKAQRDANIKMQEQRVKDEGAANVAKAKAAGKSGAGSKLTDTAVQNLGSFQIAERDLADVKAAFDKISKDWRTGPLTGRAAGWTTTWNKDFKVMEQLVNATVPNLARGVFREVGVLTDSDVERYRNMLPNAKTDPEVAKSLFMELDTKLRRGYEMVLDNYRRAGRDVSGFEPTLPGGSAKKAPATAADARRIANGGK